MPFSKIVSVVDPFPKTGGLSPKKNFLLSWILFKKLF